jgi:hypothetical protein
LDPVTQAGGNAAALADSLISQSSAELSQRLVNLIVDMRLHTDQQLHQLFELAVMANQNTIGQEEAARICHKVQGDLDSEHSPDRYDNYHD